MSTTWPTLIFPVGEEIAIYDYACLRDGKIAKAISGSNLIGIAHENLSAGDTAVIDQKGHIRKVILPE